MLGNVADVAQKEAVAALQKALQSGDVEGAGKAWQQVINSISDKVKTDCEMYNTNQKVLAPVNQSRKALFILCDIAQKGVKNEDNI